MTTSIIVDVGLLFGLLFVCLQPILMPPLDDRGDGRSSVVISRHVRTPPRRPRTVMFFVVNLVLCLVYVGLLDSRPSVLLNEFVGRLAIGMTGDAPGVAGFTLKLRPASQLLASGYLLALALTARVTWGRRLMVLAHIPLYLAMTVFTQALMIVLGLRTGLPIAPFAVEATMVNLALGALVVARVMFTTFQLPRPTTVAKSRPLWIWDSILSVGALVAATAVLAATYATLAGPVGATALRFLIPLYSSNILYLSLFLALTVSYRLERHLPRPKARQPPLDIIVPAFNEEDNLARLLRSVDVAASRYHGRVRVIVSNDGSFDSTEEVAHRETAQMRFARGEVLNGVNGGQAAALNRGMAICESEICIRIDADCVMGADALHYVAAWFDDPTIGTVGAMMMPRTDVVTWFHRLRTLEVLFNFRVSRAAQSAVDGIIVIPGTFVAYRRVPAMAAGGMPAGMNGEDADLTAMLGRRGYRAVVDPRIISYEDVPRSAGEFVEQRTRWARAGIHVFARHNPLVVGSAGPRIWYWSCRRVLSWFSLPISCVGPLYVVVAVLANPGNQRNIATVVVLYLLASALSLVVAFPLAVKYRQWKSILWMPTWFAFTFLRRAATLEAILSLPGRAVSLQPTLADRSLGQEDVDRPTRVPEREYAPVPELPATEPRQSIGVRS